MHWFIPSLLLSAALCTPGDADEIVLIESPLIIVRTNSAAEIRLGVKVKDGFHIQAHELKDDLLVPTTLVFNQSDKFIIMDPVFPSSKKFRLEGTESYLDVFDGRFEITCPVTIKETTAEGKYRLGGTLKYQACDSARCYFPKSVDFVVDVQVK